jgi:AcrR family transcriptional regulator
LDRTGTQAEAGRGRGRPPKIDRQNVVTRAMELFWEHGYDGVSYEDVTRATGVSNGSLLNAFGSKERLYNLAIDAYLTGPCSYIEETLSGEDDVFDAFRIMLFRAAHEMSRADQPTGCLVSLGVMSTAGVPEAVRDLMVATRNETERLFADRLRQGVERGQLTKSVDAEKLASYFAALLRGMAVLARDGRPSRDLESIATAAMLVWPQTGPSESSD